MEINNRFVSGSLHEEVYMSEPPSFKKEDTSLVCKLHKALYGIKQALRVAYANMTQASLILNVITPSSFTLTMISHSIH